MPFLDDVSHDRTHQIRQAFDRAAPKLVDNLKNDPETAAKAENIKEYLKNDEAFNPLSGRNGANLRQWLKADMQSDDSASNSSPMPGCGLVRPWWRIPTCVPR